MRVLLLLLASAGVCFGQAFSFNDIPYMAQGYGAQNTELNVLLNANQRGTLISSGPTGLADGKVFTFSGWIYRYAQSNDLRMVFAFMNASSVQSRWLAFINTDNLFWIQASASDGSSVLVINTTNTIATNVWTHIYGCGNAAVAGATKIYVNGVLATTNTSTRVDNTIDYVGVNYAYHFSRFTSATANLWSGGLSELWFDDSYLDDPLKFITSVGGCPKTLGSDGSLPTGSSPVFYLNRDGDNFALNSGTGGNFSGLNQPWANLSPKQCNTP